MGYWPGPLLMVIQRSSVRLLVMYRRESRRTTSLDLPLPASA
jgi:hypothetical protein